MTLPPDRETENGKHFDVSHLSSDLSQRAASGGVLVLGAQVLKIFLFLGVTAVLARLVPPNEFGHVAIILPVFYFIVDVSRSSLGPVVMQRRDISQSEVSGLFWINSFIGVGLAVLFVCAGPLLQSFYGNSKAFLIVVALALPILVAPLTALYDSILGRRMNYGRVVAVSLASEVLASIAAISTALLGWSYWAFVVQIGVRYFFGLFLAMIATRWLPSGPSHWRQGTHLLKFGGDLAAFSCFQQGANALGTIIAGRALGATAAGLYFRAWNVSMWPITRFVGPLRNVMASAMARTMDDNERAKRAMFRVVTIAAMLGAPLAAVFSTASEPLVALLLGPQWEEAGVVLAWFGLILFAMPIMITLESFIAMAGRTDILFRYGIFNGIAAAAGYGIGVQYGTAGLAASYAFVHLFLLLPAEMYAATRASGGEVWIELRQLIGLVLPFMCETAVIIFSVSWLRSNLEGSIVTTNALYEIAAIGIGVVCLHTLFCLAWRRTRVEILSLFEIMIAWMQRRLSRVDSPSA